MKKTADWHHGAAASVVVLAFVLALCFPGRGPAQAAEALNVKLVGQSDLQGRETLQVVLKGNYAYAGHHAGEEFNPLTGKKEFNGTTIIDVSNPARPRTVKHIPGGKGQQARAVQVVEKYFDGRDYLMRVQDGDKSATFEIWDISDKADPKQVSTIGPFRDAHKSWWDAKTGYGYLSAEAKDWRGRHLIIYDLKNPAQPKFVSNWGLPSQRPGGPTFLVEDERGRKRPLSLHHPVISGNRAYLAYSTGGDVVILDIADKSNPKMISHLDLSPPFSMYMHTASPFPSITCPNFTKGFTDVRNFMVVADEGRDANYKCQEIRTQLIIVDITEETNPIPVSTFKVPDGDFCERGGRFGVHQFAETKDGEIIGGTLIYTAYFDAGLRIVDIADPFKPKEVGYYIPDTTEKTKPRLKKVIQTNDVDLDYRGLVYITDRAGTGMHILEYTGKK